MTVERAHPDQLADAAVALARRWAVDSSSSSSSSDAAAERLSRLLHDEHGLAFAVGFIDGVVRPDDHRVAARNWSALVRRGLPSFLPWHQVLALRLGALAARFLPGLVVPIAARTLRAMVGHLVLDATPRRLAPALARIRASGMRPNVNLLGEAVLGADQAASRLAGVMELLDRDDVDYVSVKVSSVVAPASPWAFDENVDHIVGALLPLFTRAASSTVTKFVNLDMEEYRDLDLTIAVFTSLLDRPELDDLEAGIVLQAYLPDSMGAMERLQRWAAARRARGGAGIKVRIVKGANLPMERVESVMRGWPLATWRTKHDTDAHYKRLIDVAFEPERIANVRIGVAGHNVFDLAWAWLLAGERGVRAGVDFEMLLGMAPATAQAVRSAVGDLVVYTPTVHPAEFDVAVAYLVRRLEESVTPENFMSSMFDLDQEAVFAVEEERFRASLQAIATVPVPTNRTQDRTHEVVAAPSPGAFANTPDTDPALAANRDWGCAILARAVGSTAGIDAVRRATVDDAGVLDRIIGEAHAAGSAWGAMPAADRAAILRRAAVELERDRALLLEVMAAECGKTLDQGDPEVSEAVDFAAYYAERALDLEAIDGATFQPVALTVVTPPWNFPIAIPAGSTLAALAAGSAVVLKPAPQGRRCGSLLAQALWRAGVPAEVLRLVHVEESGLASRLITDERVDQVILTGAYETAQLFHSMRPDLRLFAETSGKNAIVVTPAADYDLAIRDLVNSAFGHAGQKCSAASLAILVGSAADSARLRTQLVDAVTSLRVGLASDAPTQVGPLIEPPSGKLQWALTELDAGESWLVRPRRLDGDGRLWSPGVRVGVRPGSAFHLTEYFGPVLGVMHAEDLDEAIALQNAVDYGLTAGLHSLDPGEQARWIDRVEAGNLYVNRGITGAIVGRQPFGGWKRSVVGTATKAGGPDHLLGLGNWVPSPARATTALDDVGGRVVRQARSWGWDPQDVARLERSVRSDLEAWRSSYGTASDVAALAVERNLLRSRPTPVTIRAASGASAVEVVRVVAAGLRAGAALRVSVAAIDDGVARHLQERQLDVRIEDDATWAAATAAAPPPRIRLIGATRGQALPDPLPAGTAVWDHPVTEAGRIEMLPFLREQAISITNHRFGTVVA
ncbi:MAG: bifunctional proline dehydrogenase/L-glutamate gamma-semialdehyde dehydrogenase [Ilumatobacteraceae bacterium]